MGKIKNPSRGKDKVSVSLPPPVDHISFSFKYVTQNSAHNFSYFKTDMRRKHDAYEALFQRLVELGQIDTTTARLRGKISGSEAIGYRYLSKPMQAICDTTGIIGKDSSVSVFRFAQNTYRLLCKPDRNHPNLLYIIAFDFDYSAYDHG